jgi:hypothetical protein
MFKLDSMKTGALNVVALAYATKLKNEYPNDEDVNELYNNLMHSLVKANGLKYDDFSNKPYVARAPKPQVIDTLAQAVKPAEPAKDNEGKSKYEKLRDQHIEAAKQEDENPSFTKYAFVGFMDKDWFKSDFQRMADTNWVNKSVDIESDRANRRRLYMDNRVYSLGIDKIVVVDPEYERINARKKEKYKYIASESGQVDFAERLKLNAKRAKLGADVLNTKNLSASESEKLNDVALMNDYISERLSHEKDIDMPFAERDRVLALAKKYNTDYFMWTGAVSLTDQNRRNMFLIMYSVIFPVILPFTLPPMINNGEYTIYYALVYDVKTDEVRLSTYREIKNRTRGYILNSHIYDVMNQVKSKPRKTKKGANS